MSVFAPSFLDYTTQHEAVHPLHQKQPRKSRIPTRSTSSHAIDHPVRSVTPVDSPSSPLSFPIRKQSASSQGASSPLLDSDDQSPIRGRRAYQRYGYLTPSPSPHRAPQDRFLPARRSPDSLTKSFRLSKPVNHLTKDELLLRTDSASPDPFSPRSPRRFVDPSRVSVLGNLPSNHNGTGVASASFRQGANDGLAIRHISAGTIWNVGGNMPAEPNHPVNAIPNGRGGLLGSGTNAPMFSSHFFESETPDESSERFEARLAAALEIDQASRTLHISQSPTRGPRPSFHRGSTAPGRLSDDSRTRWENGRWVNDRIQSCKCTEFFGTLGSSP